MLNLNVTETSYIKANKVTKMSQVKSYPTFFPKPHNMGVYGLTWSPAIIYEVSWTLGPNFGSKGPLAPNSKIYTFPTKPHNMGVYGLTWTPAII